jgi:hypothetical protein
MAVKVGALTAQLHMLSSSNGLGKHATQILKASGYHFVSIPRYKNRIPRN